MLRPEALIDAVGVEAHVGDDLAAACSASAIMFDSTGIPIEDAAAAEIVLSLTSGRTDVPRFNFRA